MVQRGDVDMAASVAGPLDIVDSSGKAVVTLLRPMAVGRTVIVVPSIRPTTFADKAMTFLQPFSMVKNWKNLSWNFESVQKLWILIIVFMATIWLLAKTNWHFICAHKRLLAWCAIAFNLHVLNLYKASLVSAYLVQFYFWSKLHLTSQTLIYNYILTGQAASILYSHIWTSDRRAGNWEF